MAEQNVSYKFTPYGTDINELLPNDPAVASRLAQSLYQAQAMNYSPADRNRMEYQNLAGLLGGSQTLSQQVAGRHSASGGGSGGAKFGGAAQGLAGAIGVGRGANPRSPVPQYVANRRFRPEISTGVKLLGGTVGGGPKGNSDSDRQWALQNRQLDSQIAAQNADRELAQQTQRQNLLGLLLGAWK